MERPAGAASLSELSVDELRALRLAAQVMSHRALLAGTSEQPLDDEMASQVAELAEWPGRLAVIRPYANDPEAYVAKAKSIDLRWKRRQGLAENDGHGYGPADAPLVPGQTAPPEISEPAGAHVAMPDEREEGQAY